MKLENFCCIGANFQNRQNDGKKQPQLFLYRSLDTNETIENMLSDGFFNTISDRVKENDLILLFHPEQENPREIVYCKVTRSDGNIVTIKKVSNVALDILVDPADSVLIPESIDAENLRDYLIALETHLNSNVVHNWEGADESVDGEKTWNEDAHFEKNISATGNLTVGGTTDITGATTIGDKLTTVGDIILENEENEQHIKFKKSNDDAIRGLITNRYVPNSLVNLSFSSFYNTGKSAGITMLAGEQIKSVVSVTAEKNDAATGDTDIHLRTIATQGWVNNPDKSLNVVHRTGNEIISDVKTFTGVSGENPYIRLKNLNRSYMDSPATDNKNANHIFFIDKNDVLFGAVETWIRDTGNYIQMNVKRNDHWATSPIGMMIDNAGTTTTYCPNPPSAANSNQIATCSWVNSKGVIRPGMIIPYGGTSAPAGYLVCNGGSYNISDYPELYNAIGYTWGSDGSKFRVPNLTQKRVLLGGNPGEYGRYLAGKLPNITANANPVTSQSNGFGSGSGAFTFTKNGQDNYTGGGWNLQWGELNFNAKRISSIYTDNYNYVTPEGYSCLYIIKT